MAGGLATGIYGTNNAETCRCILADCRANVCVVENEQQLAKILSVRDRLPDLRAIVQYCGEPNKRGRTDILSWREFLALGAGAVAAALEQQRRTVAASQRPNECAVLVYTSGTTGEPKGVMLSHDNVTWTALRLGKIIQLGDDEQRTCGRRKRWRPAGRPACGRHAALCCAP